MLRLRILMAAGIACLSLMGVRRNSGGRRGVEYEYSIPKKLVKEGSRFQRGRIESYYPEYSDEGEEFEDIDDEDFFFN